MSALEAPPENAALTVGGETSHVALASAITHRLRAHAYCEVRAIGQVAGYTALKACAAAEAFVSDKPWGLSVSPRFITEENAKRPGAEITVLVLQIRRSQW